MWPGRRPVDQGWLPLAVAALSLLGAALLWRRRRQSSARRAPTAFGRPPARATVHPTAAAAPAAPDDVPERRLDRP